MMTTPIVKRYSVKSLMAKGELISTIQQSLMKAIVQELSQALLVKSYK